MRVLTIRETVWLNASPGAVWRWVLPLEEWSDWNPTIARAEWQGATRGWKVGHRLRIHGADPRVPLGGGVVLSEGGDGTVRWTGRRYALRTEFALGVAPEGVGTRATFESCFLGLSARLASGDTVARRMGDFQRRYLESLRRIGESVPGGTP